jgi:hypothetical protein
LLIIQIDVLLDSGSSGSSSSSSGGGGGSANEEAKDYIKMLHAIVTGEWSSQEELPEDEEVG